MNTTHNIHSVDSLELSYKKHFTEDGKLWYVTMNIKAIGKEIGEHIITLFGAPEGIPFVWKDTEVYVGHRLASTEPAPIAPLSEMAS